KRKVRFDLRTRPGLRFDAEITAEQSESFAHTAQAQAKGGSLADVEADSVIDHRHSQAFADRSQVNEHGCRRAVLRYVLQTFLRDAVEAQLDVMGEFGRRLIF